MTKISEEELQRRNWDEKGFEREPLRGYVMCKIANISHWWKVFRERLSSVKDFQ